MFCDGCSKFDVLDWTGIENEYGHRISGETDELAELGKSYLSKCDMYELYIVRHSSKQAAYECVRRASRTSRPKKEKNIESLWASEGHQLRESTGKVQE